MSNLDNDTILAENKVLILYILNQLKDGILENGLYKIVSSVNNVNYFYFKDVLVDLQNSNLVTTFAKDEENVVLKITNDGKNALSLTMDVLPGLLKLKADNIFKEILPSINNESSITAEFTPKNENEYVVKCKINENNETLFEIKTFAGSGERAKKIVDNWNKNASKIYPKIIDLLLEDESL